MEGAVTNSKQEPVTGAMVVLLPENKARRQQMQFVKTGTTDQFGRFTLKNLDPGDYRMFALEDAEFWSWMDPELIARVESKGKKITLRESSQETADLTVIPVD
jgi:hypothetical protein